MINARSLLLKPRYCPVFLHLQLCILRSKFSKHMPTCLHIIDCNLLDSCYILQGTKYEITNAKWFQNIFIYLNKKNNKIIQTNTDNC